MPNEKGAFSFFLNIFQKNRINILDCSGVDAAEDTVEISKGKIELIVRNDGDKKIEKIIKSINKEGKKTGYSAISEPSFDKQSLISGFTEKKESLCETEKIKEITKEIKNKIQKEYEIDISIDELKDIHELISSYCDSDCFLSITSFSKGNFISIKFKSLKEIIAPLQVDFKCNKSGELHKIIEPLKSIGVNLRFISPQILGDTPTYSILFDIANTKLFYFKGKDIKRIIEAHIGNDFKIFINELLFKQTPFTKILPPNIVGQEVKNESNEIFIKTIKGRIIEKEWLKGLKHCIEDCHNLDENCFLITEEQQNDFKSILEQIENAGVPNLSTPSKKKFSPSIDCEIKKKLLEFYTQINLFMNETINIGFLGKHQYTYYEKIDVGIITILPEELTAVTDYFKENNTFFEKPGKFSARTYYLGKIKDKVNKELTIVAMQTIEQANRTVMAAYNALSEEFNPQLIVLLGIAGSINEDVKEDVKIGDVAICESAYYYDKRAETAEGIKRRLDPFKANAWTKEKIRKYHYENKSEKPSFCAAENNPTPKFKSHYGPIGTGEAVLKYKDAEVRKWLLSINDKTLAVETEAGGVAQQFYEDELHYLKQTKGVIILRGISDKADIDKKDEWKLSASKNAMKVLCEIIKANTL